VPPRSVMNCRRLMRLPKPTTTAYHTKQSCCALQQNCPGDDRFGVISDDLVALRNYYYVRYAPFSTEVVRWCSTS